MGRRFVHVSHLLNTHDRCFLEAIQSSFDEVHVITFHLGPLPEWIRKNQKVIIHNLEKCGRPYDDSDESRYSSIKTRLWIGWNFHRYARTVTRLVAKINPDLLQGMWVPTDGRIAAMARYHPLVIATFVTDVVLKPRVSQRLFHNIRWTLQQADRLVVDCHWVRKEIQSLYPEIEEARFCVFPRGVDLDVFQPKQCTARAKRPFRIMCNRAFEPIYDHETFFRALDEMSEIKDLEVILAGDGSLKKAIFEKIQKATWRTKIAYVGTVDKREMARLLQVSDMYVSTSHQDGASVSLLEPLASGLPCVVSDLPGNREWIRERENGFLFPIEDSKDLAEKCCMLAADRELRLRLGKAARLRAERDANWRIHQNTLVQLYEELLGERRRSL